MHSHSKITIVMTHLDNDSRLQGIITYLSTSMSWEEKWNPFGKHECRQNMQAPQRKLKQWQLWCSSIVCLNLWLKGHKWTFKMLSWQLSELTDRDNMAEICGGLLWSRLSIARWVFCAVVEVVDPVDSGTKSMDEITGFLYQAPTESQWKIAHKSLWENNKGLVLFISKLFILALKNTTTHTITQQRGHRHTYAQNQSPQSHMYTDTSTITHTAQKKTIDRFFFLLNWKIQGTNKRQFHITGEIKNVWFFVWRCCGKLSHF